jgi:hypothetical protein
VRLAALLAIVVTALTGCTHTRPLFLASPEARTELNRRAEAVTVLVTLRGDTQVRARALRVEADSTSWLDPASGAVRSVPTADLATVRFTDRGRGVAEGSGLGLLIGAGFGLLLRAVSGDSRGDRLLGLTAVQSAALVPGFFGGIGLGIGGVAGADRGSWTIFEAARAAVPESRN